MNTQTIVDTSQAVELGIAYLRVSSKRQMDTAADVDPDGNSIGTQREYCQNKAKSMHVMLQKEFLEPGNSAISIEKRPVFRELLAYLNAHPEIKYVFIYMRSRAFRNYTDAAITKRALLNIGVKLVSAKEDFGEGIMADAMEAVTDIMNEVQVRLSGQDISVKMANKVKNGGSVGLARLGYTNARIDFNGHKVNTIGVDAERAPLVQRAFELFGTGKYTLDSLHETMGDLGLTATGRNKPVGRDTLGRMLRDRYYIGKVIYKGIEYQGRHDPLITSELFDRVQRTLDAHSGSGTRERKHPHYLKGLVWCGRCQYRYIIMPGRGNGGEYFYFTCRGRQQKMCDQPYIPVDVMEKAVEQHYTHAVILPEDLRANVRAGVEAAVANHFELSDDMRGQFTRQLEKLDRKENYFLDLAAEEDWPKDKLRSRITAIRDEQKKIRRQLEAAATQLETGRQVFLTALDLLDDPHGMYQHGHEAVRSILNRAFFTRLYVDGHKVTEQVLQEPFDMLGEAYRIYRDHQAEQRGGESQSPRTYHRHGAAETLTDGSETDAGASDPLALLDSLQTANSAGSLVEETDATSRDDLIDLLALALAGHGSSKPVLVGMTGFEPATP
ncbi:recombinase family protein [Amycolatopsis sp. H20-H5]|uniref:recombinase family protein n=1 Tax=Amycolatopsis sp. H20-H5 TaxID=3046309 RepID=UPI002DB937AA|nr:recombinase family protein [Amycolatopsis sp. H20-H5]MEC3976233.1 recombinase family protein [Amycolatopsis sp. H20-H5]